MTGGVKGPIQGAPVTTTEPSTTDEVTQEGKIPGGSTVKVEGGSTPVKDGSDVKGTTDTPIEERNTQQLPDTNEEVTVEESANHLELLSDAIKDDNGDEYIKNPAQIPDELQWVTDDEFKEALGDVKTAFKPFESIKSGAKRLGQALSNFVQKFRANKEMVPEMANAMAQLVDTKVEDGESVKQASESVGKLLEESPKALLKELEAQGLHETVSDLKESFKVATSKNLAKMKSKLVQPEAMKGMRAIQGMSQEKAELVINGALIAAKLANAGGGSDASSLEGRGYLLGRIPAEKFKMVEWVLNMDPEMVIEVLSTHPRLASTTFAADLRSADRKEGDAVYGPRMEAEGPITKEGSIPTAREKIADSIEDIFEDGALPMFEEAEAGAELHDNFKAFLEKKKNSVLLERRERAGQRFKETGMSDAISQEILQAGISHLKETGFKRENENNDILRVQYLKEQARQRFGFNKRFPVHNDAAVMGEHRLLRNKYKSGDALPEDQAQEIAGIYKDVHKEVRGLMRTLTEKDGEEFLDADAFEENAVRLTNAMLVNAGYAVFTDPKSQDNIIDTFHAAFEHDFDGMTPEEIGKAVFQNKAAMAQRVLQFMELLAKEGPIECMKSLSENPAVNESQ